MPLVSGADGNSSPKTPHPRLQCQNRLNRAEAGHGRRHDDTHHDSHPGQYRDRYRTCRPDNPSVTYSQWAMWIADAFMLIQARLTRLQPPRRPRSVKRNLITLFVKRSFRMFADLMTPPRFLPLSTMAVFRSHIGRVQAGSLFVTNGGLCSA